RPAGLFNDLRKPQIGERSLRRWLKDDRAARRDRRSEFVSYEIYGEVERSDRGNRPERKSPHNSPATRGGGLPIQRQVLAANAHSLFGGNAEREDRAIDFDARGLQR